MTQGGDSKIKLFGRKGSTDGFELREFLQRQVIDFDWIEIDTDKECLSAFGIDDVDNVRFPVVQLTDGTQLFDPTAREMAERLGYVSRPRLKKYDVSIYGAGPAGLSAAVYAASEGLSTIVVERRSIGGQAGTSSLIENYMGFPKGISGAELADRAREQALKFGAEIILMSEGVKVQFQDNHILVELADGSNVLAKSGICATGIQYRRLGLEREDDFLGKGIFYGGGVAEAPLCKNETVYVVGGANSAGQATMNFSKYAKNVVMLVRESNLKDSMSQYLCDRVHNQPNVEIRFNTEITALDGDGCLRQITTIDRKHNKVEKLDAKRVFVAIGGVPNTDWAIGTPVQRDEGGYLITGPDLITNGAVPELWPLERRPYFLETSVPGLFAAGDVRHNSIKRVATAVGEGAMATTLVHRYLGERIK